MDMNKIFFQRKEDCFHKWHVIDAKGKVLGRLATQIADLLSGKNKTDFARHSDNGDYVVITNARDIVLTGNKMKDKIYTTVSGYIGGKKELTAEQVMKRDCTRLIHHAVKGMMPKNKLSSTCLTRLKVYAGPEHPHTAQVTKKVAE
jgi:large subunit ribosomal protein L13